MIVKCLLGLRAVNKKKKKKVSERLRECEEVVIASAKDLFFLECEPDIYSTNVNMKRKE
jgi:hypothetical protein